MSFLLDKCTFSTLDSEVLSKSKLDCEHNDLNDFFQNDCIPYSQQLLGKSYCFVCNDSPEIIVCAFSVSNDSIRTSLLEKSVKRKIDKGIPHIKQRKSYPAVLIGRLGVNQQFKRKNIGSDLMDFIKSWFFDSNKTGCRFIVVDSYNEPIALSYYQKNGFNFLFKDVIEEKKHCGIKEPYSEELRTRLMYFDLIVLSNSNNLEVKEAERAEAAKN